MSNARVYAMIFAKVYPMFVNKAEKKGRTQAEVDQINRALEERYPETNRGWLFAVQDFQSGLADNTFWVLCCGSGQQNLRDWWTS